MNKEMNKKESEQGNCCYERRKKVRTEKEYKDLLNRLSRIEGQVRGIGSFVNASYVRFDGADDVLTAEVEAQDYHVTEIG